MIQTIIDFMNAPAPPYFLFAGLMVAGTFIVFMANKFNL